MSIILQKHEEDLLLATCDGTCFNKDECKCIVDFKTNLAGQALYDYGFTTCLLCQRANGQEFITIPESYPPSWIYDEYKIKYNKQNYKRNDTGGIDQIIDESKEEVNKETWVNSMYYTSTELVDETIVNWKLAVCDMGKCKHPVHTYIDVSRAICVSNSYYDVMNKVVKCEQCHVPLRYIESKNGIVEFRDQKYTKCRFCKTVIFYKDGNYIQACTSCYDKCRKDDQKSRHICLYCNNSVNVSQRRNIQEFQIRKTPTSRIETVYLCRLHRIYPPDPTKIFKISELLSMF
jgi:hypothetical protein